jgi:hypothetical protein
MARIKSSAASHQINRIQGGDAEVAKQHSNGEE